MHRALERFEDFFFFFNSRHEHLKGPTINIYKSTLTALERTLKKSKKIARLEM